jgi:hypothetical protein
MRVKGFRKKMKTVFSSHADSTKVRQGRKNAENRIINHPFEIDIPLNKKRTRRVLNSASPYIVNSVWFSLYAKVN